MKKIIFALAGAAVIAGCTSSDNEFAQQGMKTDTANTKTPVFKYVADQFYDLRVLRYQVKDFEQLDLAKKELLYYLYEAALSGRDIIYDQNYKYNLAVRKTLESIITHYQGTAYDPEFDKLVKYAKRFWFSNGMHHHYNQDKFTPECTREFFMRQLSALGEQDLPLRQGESKSDFMKFITDQVFDPNIAPKKVNLDPKNDLLTSSAVNFYEGLTEKEASAFYTAQAAAVKEHPPMFGLNSKLVKEKGTIVEKKWMVGGMYTQAIERIVYWLEKAAAVAEDDEQRAALEALVKFYRTGDLGDFDAYNIAWVKDTKSEVDVVNGFIETYSDPLNKKGSFESVVSVKDLEASKRIAAIGAQAQWFEDNSPILPQHKKDTVKGISAKVINAVVESGDAAPSTPIGINLPNNEWIREKHGSKSVNLGNIVEAYDQAAGASVINEFYYDKATQERVRKYASLADKLHTDMHEVIGHASGKLETGVKQPDETLKNYASTLEEGRADLVALYYLMDPKLVELGVMPSLEYGKAAYDEYITRGLVIQLSRIKPGKNIEEAHMRNRHYIAAWCFEKGAKDNVISQKVENGKTYYIVNDYAKLRALFGELLREIQRIKSQGDYKAGSALVETYGVKIDPTLHKEVLERYEKLNIPPYAGFIQPRLLPVTEHGQLKDVIIEYPDDFKAQMMEYGRLYSFLPAYN